MTTLNCICIKWGTTYSISYVNRLYRAVKRNTTREVRFLCMTETADGLAPEIEFLPLIEQPYEAVMQKEQKRAYKKTEP